MAKFLGVISSLFLFISVQVASAVEESAAPWHESRTENFQILHQGQAEAVNHALARLERLRVEFVAYFSAHGYTLAERSEPLEWRWFGERGDFDRYVMESDAAHLPHLAEYYSSRTNRVAVYRPSESEGAVDLRHRMAHEAAHQLAFNLGLHKRGTMLPIWLAEGLAMHCETMLHDDAEAMTAEVMTVETLPHNAMRARVLEQAVARDELLPLSGLTALTEWDGLAGISREAFYAQSWSLFEFLWHERPDAMRRFIADHSNLEWGWRSPTVVIQHFEAVFGEMEQVEAQWRATLPDYTAPEPDILMFALNQEP